MCWGRGQGHKWQGCAGCTRSTSCRDVAAQMAQMCSPISRLSEDCNLSRALRCLKRSMAAALSHALGLCARSRTAALTNALPACVRRCAGKRAGGHTHLCVPAPFLKLQVACKWSNHVPQKAGPDPPARPGRTGLPVHGVLAYILGRKRPALLPALHQPFPQPERPAFPALRAGPAVPRILRPCGRAERSPAVDQQHQEFSVRWD